MYDLLVVVSREDVEAGNTGPTSSVLKSLLESVDTVRAYEGAVEIAFHGYDADRRELFEIDDVRNFLHKLDLAFPYWLFFLSKFSTGLQAVAFCFLPPSLTKAAQLSIWPKRLDDLVERRWGPALLDLMGKAGYTQAEAEAALTEAGHYFVEGPRRPGNIGSSPGSHFVRSAQGHTRGRRPPK